MKVVSIEALTKLIQLIKSSFISNTDVVETSEVDIYTKAQIDVILGDLNTALNNFNSGN